ncbi:MAG: formylglycine-generating enzyme family protein, partial [Elusimicrobia bacterium]|nr:formylglycine-generating enzyme family protein [Elusimicrobiota bacterium]
KVDVTALEKYNAAYELDKSAQATPEDKAASWRRLALDVPQYADMAGKRAAQWDAFAAQKKAAEAARLKRVAARDRDWEKLSPLLSLAVVPEADKANWSDKFLRAYYRSPGVRPGMAKVLVRHVPAGALHDALVKLALKATKDEETQAAPRSATEKAGIQWVRIPGGTFSMGASDQSNAQPHQVTVKSFQMAKTLVTNRQYKACVAAGACTAADDQGPAFDGDDQPVVGVDWNQAKAFSKWVGGRLPSEAEWEYAARSAGKDWKYPWGDETATCDNAVIAGCGYNATSPVCSKPKGNTKQGLCDMAGNVWEWVEDKYHDSYKGAPTDGSAWEDAGSFRVVRGGSWLFDAARARSAYRYSDDPGNRGDYLVFRPAR